MQAAILRERLKYLPAWTAKRREIARTYREELAGAPVQVPPETDAGHVYHLFPVLTGRREALQAHLTAAGVETLVHYPIPIPNQPAMAECAPARCPIADRVCAELVSLPIYPSLPMESAREVARAVQAFPREA